MSNDNIALHPLGSIPLSALEPNEDVVKLLEDALIRARDGQIQAFAGVLIDRTGVPESFSSAPRAAFHPMNSTLCILQHRIIAEYLAGP